MKTKIYFSAVLFFSLMTMGGCKKFLDINTDPNHAADVPVTYLLSSAEGELSFAVGNTLAIAGGVWGQYWTQNPSSSQYKLYDQYSPDASTFGNVWEVMNSDALEDMQQVIDNGKATNKPQYVAIATILKVYTFQLSTDLWGDVPFSQALQGKNNLSPAYDKQSDIYNGLVKMLDDAIALINPDDPNVPGNDDLIYQGDMNLWLRFANTLKLKIGLRLSKADPARAMSIVKSLEGKEFMGSGETGKQDFNATGGQQNPLYGAIAGAVLGKVQNLVASSTAIGFFNGHNDPRLKAFFDPTPAGTFVGIPQGSFNAQTSGAPISPPSAKTGANANNPKSASAPVILISDYESSFLQAEAVVRGWLSGDAAALYADGIRNNFAAYGVTGVDGYLAQPDIAFPVSGSAAQTEAIITQKWAAMCGNQCIEAWTEWRRTGFPSFFVLSQGSIIGPGRFPQIFLYPASELTRNPKVPPQHNVFDKVWWAGN
ncbi:MAG TPA: SusD/RagB family nutrient-binding outer membrane lipoprotein [Chitinophaga sp.]|uniref:SusD/RagB family nutrient-binding outer membrane lipoprotein n=1 Tax=Chitinophaga sp. TaxID=1869181 RepID=UPI002C996489|nr:SusD/RagB family nutrient-binding outer membrane lipoprotein [Chitinophaga sp.]HVI47809.1 SusD/RagB family nutrient-binding outer membrane lipoprotein [Chitinophaga sp.]